MTAEKLAAAGTDDAMRTLGHSLREARLRAGLSLREMARQLGVSPSFVSQLENGKSQPSVATLYSTAQLLGVSIDELFQYGPEGSERPTPEFAASQSPGEPIDVAHRPIRRSDLGTPADAWPNDESESRLAIVRPESRPRLEMDSGVIWEQLASNGGGDLDFMEIIYPAGSSSTNDGRMLRHPGREYGYLLQGVLVITYGFDKYTLRAGESMALDPEVPHLLTNPGTEAARGIWVVQHSRHA